MHGISRRKLRTFTEIDYCYVSSVTLDEMFPKSDVFWYSIQIKYSIKKTAASSKDARNM